MLAVKNLLVSARYTTDSGSIPESGRSPGEGNGNPVKSSCLENPMDRGAWQATVHGVAKSWKLLSTQACTQAYQIKKWTSFLLNEKASLFLFCIRCWIHMRRHSPVLKEFLVERKTHEGITHNVTMKIPRRAGVTRRKEWWTLSGGISQKVTSELSFKNAWNLPDEQVAGEGFWAAEGYTL